LLSHGVAKSPPYGVTAFFQDLDILDVLAFPLGKGYLKGGSLPGEPNPVFEDFFHYGALYRLPFPQRHIIDYRESYRPVILIGDPGYHKTGLKGGSPSGR
jgi:hypothetical protein